MNRVQIRLAKRVFTLFVFIMFTCVGYYVNAQNSVRDRHINTLNVFNVDSTKKTVLPHRMQPASVGSATNYSDSLERAKKSISKVITLLAEGNIAMALFNVQDALNYTPLKDIKTYAIATSYYAVIQIKLDNHTKAVNALNKSDSLFRVIGDINLLAFHYNNLGLFYQKFQNSTNADRYFKESLSISRKLNDKANIATTLNHLSKGKDPINQRVAYLREAIEINNKLDKQVSLAQNY